MATGLLLLLDDITTILDDVAVLTKVATQKTAGVLGDDLALNAEQVSGVNPQRELPVVWAVAKGSLVNKVILVPSAMLLSTVAPATIAPLMIAGGTYLCFEGCEKLAHKFLHADNQETPPTSTHETLVADETIDLVAVEKGKIAGAIRTDFVLSAEIVVITLGTVANVGFATRFMVLASIGLLMTVGVYGLVAAIVKLDDFGMRLLTDSQGNPSGGLSGCVGRLILTGAPYLMQGLSIAGTAAMFLVGGGILVHGIPPLHHLVEDCKVGIASIQPFGNLLAVISELLAHAMIGVCAGAVVLLVVNCVKKLRSKNDRQTHAR